MFGGPSSRICYFNLLYLQLGVRKSRGDLST